jgi:hypothetical protein
MKKLLFFAAVVFVIAIGSVSCKSVQDCPAYGSTQTEQPSQKA